MEQNVQWIKKLECTLSQPSQKFTRFFFKDNLKKKQNKSINKNKNEKSI